MRWIMMTAMCLVAQPAFAADDKAEECVRQAELVMQIVTARTDGKRQRRAEREVRKGLSEDLKHYDGLVPAVADWVYGLPEEVLDDSVGAAWETQCKAAL